jgi:ABC-type bacteriocin/lantibiotic exporter with double-glycine peptidase domain
MAYYGADVREDELICELNSDSNGTQIQHLVAVAERHGFKVMAKYDATLDEVKKSIDEEHPVIVLVQAWRKNT